MKKSFYGFFIVLTTWVSLSFKVELAFGAGSCDVTPSSYAGFTIDAGRGISQKAIESTRAIVKADDNSTTFDTNPYVLFSTHSASGDFNPDITTIINVNGSPHLETAAEQNANYNGFTAPDPGSSDPKYPGNLTDSELFRGTTQSGLFNFGRYKEAAVRTGNYYEACDFVTNVLPTNPTFHGIVYITVDYNSTCNTTNGGKVSGSTFQFKGSGSITVYGSLVVEGINAPTPKDFTIKLTVPLRINPITGPVTGSTTLTYSDYANFKQSAINGTFNPSGNDDPYQKTWTETIYTQPTKNPIGLDLGAAYPKFASNEDLPALMLKGGKMKPQKMMNINGLVYSPVGFELDYSGSGQTMFVNGAIVTGQGVELEDLQCSGGVFVSFAPKTIDRLGVLIPKTISRRGYKVL